jgi:D-beta-D-heptose 7-phosphate kinase/D-beta-D-heptose 1-phosphate adenosyltransferase
MLLSNTDFIAACRELREQGRTIVFTNGCFDILHAGHVAYLEAAAALGDLLVVGINSDRSIRALKGPSRPIVPEEDRAEVIAALRSVAMATIFDEDTPLDLIRAIIPGVIVKGGDYDPEATDGPRYIVGSDVVREHGGEVRVINLVEGRSTTSIIARVLAAYRN